MGKKLKHHFVPAGVLKNFCAKEKTLYLYDNQQQRISRSSPRDAMMKKKGHSISRDGETEDHDFVEDILQQVEGPGINGIDNLLSGENIGSATWYKIISLVALQSLQCLWGDRINRRTRLELGLRE